MTINLRTGEQYPPRREDYCTKLAGTKSNPNTPTPLWDAFLKRVSDDQIELVEYLQRVSGYCLSGDISEQALFFLYGTGGNGKGVFVNTLAGIMGDYAVSVPSEVLMASQTDRHPTELARLRGVRMAYASETEEGRRWAESRIKNMTGGAKMQGRFMRQDFFEFIPQFKLIISGNHKPSLRSVDEAIKRRMHLIPFTVTIPESERDTDLEQKLKKEWPGIFAWAVKGCLEWRRIGLKPPVSVRKATDSYLATQDAVTSWLAECCEERDSAWTKRSDLYNSWTRWAERNGEFVGNRSRFIDALEARKFEKSSRKGIDGFKGLMLVTGLASSGGDPRPEPDDIPF